MIRSKLAYIRLWRVRVSHLVRFRVRQLTAGLARQAFREQPTTHPDAPVDAPYGQRDPSELQRLAPGERVRVDTVGEGAVEVQQNGGTVYSGSIFSNA